MKITSNRPVSGARAVQGASGYSSAAKPVSASAPAQDTSSILGIPEAEFTPRVRDAIMKLMSEADRLRQELQLAKHRLGELEEEANQDPLVPSLNRRAFVRELSRIISFAERYNLAASLLYFDLDGFKDINDEHGHAAGDAVLSHVSKLLAENVRESDIVGRLGGDEFGVILAKAENEAAHRKAESLAVLISTQPVNYESRPLRVSCSFGIYTFQKGEDATEAIARADRAMYETKKQKKR